MTPLEAHSEIMLLGLAGLFLLGLIAGLLLSR